MIHFEKVFSPGQIGKLQVPNRFTATAAVTCLADEEGRATENLISYYEAKAKGGWGLIITEDFAVDIMGKSFTRVPGLWEDAQTEGYKELTGRVHAYPSRIFCQLFHAGRQTTRSVLGGESPVAASRLPDPLTGESPRALTTAEVEELVRKFGDAAARAKAAGFDGVEIHGGHGYLLNEFFSHYSNKRIDKYGGNILNRCRFATEILQEIRRRCGKDYPVGIRLSADEMVPGGLTVEDAKVIAMLMEDAGADVINVSAGLNGSIGGAVVPPSAVRHGIYTDLAEAVKKVVNVPVIGLGRINDPFLAESILLSGKCDFVGMLRASMADPELPKKVDQGNFRDIVTCVGCLIGCSGNLAKGLPASCVFNPTMGRETELEVQEAAVKKNVVVAGGGVGGCMAAITAARRGHRVTLIEKNAQIGGQYHYAAIPPGKGEITSYLVWQKTQLDKLGVMQLMNTEATPELLDTLEPDAVIVAVGARPILPDIRGVRRENVYTAQQVLDGDPIPGKNCVVLGGGLVGAETAHHLMHHAKHVEALVEMQPEILTDMPRNSKTVLLREFRESGLRIMTDTVASEITGEGMIVSRGGKEELIPADFIVIAAGCRADRTLYDSLKNRSYEVTAIGDAIQARRAYEAIHEGFHAALAI